MIPIKQIVFNQAEGLHADCRAHACASWPEVERLVQRLARKAPTDSCYKCDVFVTWSDGREAAFRFELTRAHVGANAPVASEVRHELEFLSGRVTPAHMTQEQHEGILCTYEECNPKLRERASKILDGYELGGALS